AVLHGIREGTVATDAGGRITLVNDEAKRLLGLDGDAVGKLLAEVVPAGHVRDVLSGKVDGPDEVVLVGDRVLVVNRMPVSVRDHVLVALLLGKAAIASERGVELRVSVDERLPDLGDVRDLVTVIGNLVDNALDSVTGSPGAGWIDVSVCLEYAGIVVRVHDS